MANRHIQDIVLSRIKAAKEQADAAAAALGHNGLKGRMREIAVSAIIEPFLLTGFGCGGGKITDSTGHTTAETDIVVFSRRAVPSFLFDERTGLFPAEAVTYAVEVKSRLTATEVRDAVAQAETIRSLRRFPRKDNAGNIVYDNTGPATVLLAFGSDISMKSELSRYLEVDPRGKDSPAYVAIVVVGRGYWWFKKGTGWVETLANPDVPYQEVLGFCTGLSNTLGGIANSMRGFNFGEYLDPPGDPQIASALEASS